MTEARMEPIKKFMMHLPGNPKVKVFTKPNGGKASALNFGIQQSSAEFVICIDADTKLLPDAVSKLMMHFYTPQG